MRRTRVPPAICGLDDGWGVSIGNTLLLRFRSSSVEPYDDVGHVVFPSSDAVSLIGDLLHPVDDIPVFDFQEGDMRRGRRRRSAVPMFFAPCKPDDVT